jgi:hypothetical protein
MDGPEPVREDRERALARRVDLRDELVRARRARGEPAADADTAARRLEERLLRRHTEAVARAALDPETSREALERRLPRGSRRRRPTSPQPNGASWRRRSPPAWPASGSCSPWWTTPR